MKGIFRNMETTVLGAILLGGSAFAFALDAPRSLHHTSRPAEPTFSDSHRSAHHAAKGTAKSSEKEGSGRAAASSSDKTTRTRSKASTRASRQSATDTDNSEQAKSSKKTTSQKSRSHATANSEDAPTTSAKNKQGTGAKKTARNAEETDASPATRHSRKTLDDDRTATRSADTPVTTAKSKSSGRKSAKNTEDTEAKAVTPRRSRKALTDDADDEPAPRGKAARATLKRRRAAMAERFTASSFTSNNIFADDVTTGEDPIVRQAAIDAMGNMNGTAVVIDPSNGRILAMVNQKLALSPGAEPCSTIKITVAMAALSEGLVTRDTPVHLGRGFSMNMTEALAHSNNLYFEALGRQLGFERVHHYATEFGLGELAGYRIPGEQLGTYPDHEIPASAGGVGRMCSFGQGISLTPLQLGAYVAALANGGTLYYLQHPTTSYQLSHFQPHVKRTLEIARYIPEMVDGMAGSVEYGTGRSLRANFRELPVFGKTGTCSDRGTRFGWFASFSQTPQGGLVSVFFLEGGRPTFGPKAAELTGLFYKNLWEHNYFQSRGEQPATASTAHPVYGEAQP